VSIDVNNASIEQVLQLCLKDKPLTYVIFEKTIVIKPKAPEPAKRPDAVETPPDPLTGIVLDETGKPVAGAIRHRKMAGRPALPSATAFPGNTNQCKKANFSLQAITGNAVLYISSIGYTPLQMPVTAQSTTCASFW